MTELTINKVRGFASVVYLSHPDRRMPEIRPYPELADLIRTLVPKNPNWKFVLTSQGRVRSLKDVNRAATTAVRNHDVGEDDYMHVRGCSILSQHDELLGHVYYEHPDYVITNRRIDVAMERGDRRKTSINAARAARIITEYFKPMAAAEAVYEAAETYRRVGEGCFDKVMEFPKSAFSEMREFMKPKRNTCRDPLELGSKMLEFLVQEELHERAESQKAEPENIMFAALYQGKIALGFIDEWERLPKGRVRPVVGDCFVCELRELPEQYALRVARLKQVGERKDSLFGGKRLVWHADTGCKVDDLGFALWCPDPDEARTQLNPYRA